MERKVGEIFTYNSKTYQVVESNMCKDCAFFNTMCKSFQTLVAGTCTPGGRKDKTNVIFKEINNMENNQLTINIPEGMEIDLENSNLAKGIIKFRDKWLTLERIHGSTKEDCYLTNSCDIRDYHNNKLVAIANLMDIARYFNGNWKYDVTKEENIGYMIVYDGSIEEPNYTIHKIEACSNIYYGNVIFKNKDDAKYVIANPNFRNILDAIYKN